MLQVRPDRPISPILLALIRTLDQIAQQFGAPYFVIGATARDLLMRHVYAIDTGRATRDIDLAIGIASWDVFAELKKRLIATGDFLAGAAPQCLLYGGGPGAYPPRPGAVRWRGT